MGGWSWRGFNEAAALLPRKARRSRRATGRFRARFNEAAALLPRKAQAMDCGPSGLGVASMRPRHCCRGRQAARAPAAAASAASLQ